MFIIASRGFEARKKTSCDVFFRSLSKTAYFMLLSYSARTRSIHMLSLACKGLISTVFLWPSITQKQLTDIPFSTLRLRWTGRISVRLPHRRKVQSFFSSASTQLPLNQILSDFFRRKVAKSVMNFNCASCAQAASAQRKPSCFASSVDKILSSFVMIFSSWL